MLETDIEVFCATSCALRILMAASPNIGLPCDNGILWPAYGPTADLDWLGKFISGNAKIYAGPR